MSQSQDYEALLVQHLPFVEKMAAILCRRDGLSPDETDDFASWARERLLDDDYAVFRKFRGESALTTYLTMVLSRLYHDHRVSRWGRWRPSAEARRRGSEAVALERLVHRDRNSLVEAVTLLRSRGETTLSERELFEVFESLHAGTKSRPTFVGDAPLATAASGEEADAAVLAEEHDARRERMLAALRRVVDGLPPDEAVVIRMKFLEGLSVADIARVRGVEQKPLYRRIEGSLRRMRGDLEAAGISRQDLVEILSESEK